MYLIYIKYFHLNTDLVATKTLLLAGRMCYQNYLVSMLSFFNHMILCSENQQHCYKILSITSIFIYLYFHEQRNKPIYLYLQLFGRIMPDNLSCFRVGANERITHSRECITVLLVVSRYCLKSTASLCCIFMGLA